MSIFLYLIKKNHVNTFVYLILGSNRFNSAFLHLPRMFRYTREIQIKNNTVKRFLIKIIIKRRIKPNQKQKLFPYQVVPMNHDHQNKKIGHNSLIGRSMLKLCSHVADISEEMETVRDARALDQLELVRGDKRVVIGYDISDDAVLYL